MKPSPLAMAFLLPALAAVSWAADPAPVPPPPRPQAPAVALVLNAAPYAFLTSFIGGVWSGPLAAGADGVARTIELHFAWTENKKGVRFASWIVNGQRRAPYVSGMYAWNPAKGKMEMFYTDSGGSLTEGLVTQDGDAMVHDLSESNSDGSVDTVRVRLTKVDDDNFLNESFILADGNYGKIAEVHYERPSADSAHQP